MCVFEETYIVGVSDDQLLLRIVGTEQLDLGFGVLHLSRLLVKITARSHKQAVSRAFHR